MMHEMEIFKEKLMVHHSMCPIKISIMQKNQHKRTEDKIHNSIIADIVVDPIESVHLRPNDEYSG